MIVVAIIGILAAIAIPAYQDYTIRAKVTEAVNAMAPGKTAVAEFFTSQGSMPADADEAGFETNLDTQYVNSVVYARLGETAAHLTVDVKDLGGETEDGHEFSLRASGGTASVEWDCLETLGGGTAIENKYLPADCRS